MRLIKYPGNLPKKIDGVGSAKIDFNNLVCIFFIATINRNLVLILVKEIYSNLTPLSGVCPNREEAFDEVLFRRYHENINRKFHLQ